jgi:hypothetical protein
MTEAIWAALAFLLGWKAAAAAGGDPHAAASSAATGAKNAVHQAVTQASDTVWSAVWSVTWHLALIALVILALVYGASVLLRRARTNILGR